MGEKLMSDGDDSPSFESEDNRDFISGVSVSVSPDYTPIDRLVERDYDEGNDCVEDPTFNIGNLVKYQ